MQLQVMNSPFNQKQVELLNELLINLSQTQRLWLSGYLSAVSFVEEPSLPKAATSPQAQTNKEITLLYGTQTGNAEQLANMFADTLKNKAYEVTQVSMGDFRPNNLRKISNLLVIISTHGEGDPPDQAISFYEFLFSNRAPKLDQLQYSVLALGDRSYEHFCLTGKEIDQRLEELGGKRIAPRVDCDVDFDEPAQKWFDRVATSLEEQQGPEETVVHGNFSQREKVTTLYSRTNPFEAEVFENINLNGRGSNKETRHLELSLEGSGLSYEPGDCIGIFPENDPSLVDELIKSLAWNPDQELTIKGEAYTVKEALTSYYEITVLTKALLEKIAEQFTLKALEELLQDEDRLRSYLMGRDLLDLVRDFNLKGLPAEELTSLLRKIPPRLYSVASSQRANPDEVHLTIGLVKYETGGRVRKGVCSSQCAERLAIGDRIKIYVHRNSNFKLPESPDTPIIMIGPGTGVAPFRSFLEEREEIGAEGKAWLFFGDQHYVTDFLYQTDWQRWIKAGVLTRLDLAFSRDTDEKIYVQHRMLAQKEEFFRWLEEGAVVYVCGDEANMAKDVHRTLLQIVKEEGKLSEKEAEAYVQRMQREKRYLRDVY